MWFLGSEYQYSRNVRFAYSGALIVEEGSPNTINLYAQYYHYSQMEGGNSQPCKADWILIQFLRPKDLEYFISIHIPEYQDFVGNLIQSVLSFDFINEKQKIETPIFFLN